MSLTTFSGPVKSNAGFIGPVAQSALTAASTLTAADSGNVYFLDSATEFATTLPAPAAFHVYREVCPVWRELHHRDCCQREHHQRPAVQRCRRRW